MAEQPTTEEIQLIQSLSTQLGAAVPTFDSNDMYYDGEQVLDQLGLAIPDDLMRFTVIVNWPRVVVDATADRLDVKGFRLPGGDEGDEDLWSLWQANGMDDQDQMSKLDYLIHGRTYKCVGSDDELGARITVESPHNMITDRDPRTGKVRAALRLYGMVNGHATLATLYRPNETVSLERSGVGTTLVLPQRVDAGGSWGVVNRDEHGLGEVLVVPTFRRRRTRIPSHGTMQGVSAMKDVIPITDSAARNLTNAQVAQETHAVPARGVLGATKGDFVDQSGNPLPQWAAYFGSVWAITNKDAKSFQFDSSDMANFERMTDLYARLASGVSALPPNYFGLAADDAASADAIRSREARHVKVAERDQVALGLGDRETMRLAVLVRDGKAAAEELRGMETLWYDAGTPTVAQRTDAVVKMHQARDGEGRPLLPARAAYEELGYSPAKIERFMQWREEESRDPTLERIARDFAPTER